MATTARLRFQDYQFQVTISGGAWKWTTRIDLTLSVATTQIRDVITPYGLYRDSIPLPGPVVEAMAESITEVLQAYQATILLNPLTLEFVVDEGRGVSGPKSVQITNTGILGSLLSATITSSAAYVTTVPAAVPGLGANASGSFNASVDSTNLLEANSPYSETLTVQADNTTNSPQTVPVSIIVRPKATITLTPTSLNFYVAAPLTGPFPTIPSQQLLLENTGPATSVLDYQIRKLIGVPWVTSFAPPFGSVNGGASQAITIVVAPRTGMTVGVYTETLRVTGYSTNLTVDVAVTLNIT